MLSFKSQKVVYLVLLAMICSWLPAGVAWGQVIVVPPPGLNPLNQTAVPEPPQLFLYVKNKSTAIQLGKAFFWDMQAGSDGIVACATCHFSAGVDKRTKNTLNPGTRAGDTLFGNNTLGVPDVPQFRPNYTLDPVNDFPLHRRQGTGHLQTDPIIQDTNDVVGSQGVRLSDFTGVIPGSAIDSAPASEVDPIFHDPVHGNLRRVTGRNAPTMINAVFSFTNFWDGRANFIFNGENPFGPADENAGVWFDDPAELQLVKQPVAIEFASLASQATGPPLDTIEMSGRGRTFPLFGRKMLSLTPLGKQLVSHDDSVLGGLAKSARTPGAKGLHAGYAELIQQAFNDNLWSSTKLTPQGFTQMEANFSLFWGLAVQLYEATLVSGDAPFDRWLAGDPNALTENQKFGFSLFSGIGNCTVCHFGTEFTDHSVASIAFQNNAINNTIAMMFAADGRQVIYDEGFVNNAIRPTAEDIGRGGNTPFINPLNGQHFPLSFAHRAELQRQNLLPFETPILEPFIPVDMPFNSDGCFKVPGLRNVELTGPYFHNGSDMFLDDVLDFYSRGGNFPQMNVHELDPVIGAGLSLIANKQPLHEAIVDFLKSLTDPRVRNESAPFDHPEIFLPEGAPEVLTHIPARNSDGTVFATAINNRSVDFNGDKKTDVAVYRANSGDWNIIPSPAGIPYQIGWGGDPTDIPVAGDYDGDGRTDLAIYRASSGAWWIIPSATGAPYGVGYGGGPTDIPVPGDYDGDGRIDLAIYRQVWGAWYIQPSGGGAPIGLGWGGDPSDIPVPGDYDGDGRTDIAIYRSSNGAWWIIPSTTGIPYGVGHGGAPSDIPVPGDYDGDGKMDIAIYRAAWGAWYIQPSGGGPSIALGWGGGPTDIPVPGDYDGDGKTDIAIYRANTGTWWIIPSLNGVPYAVGLGGGPSDIPVTQNLASTLGN